MVAAPGVSGFDPGDKRDRNLVKRELSDRAAAPRVTATPPPSWNPAPASLDLAWAHDHARNLELCAAHGVREYGGCFPRATGSRNRP